MTRRSFRTVTDDLADIADAAAAHYQSFGYRLAVEKCALGFPYTPTMVATRGRTTLIVEVHTRPQLTRLKDWVNYSRSSRSDYRVVLCLPAASPLGLSEEAELRNLGVGCLHISGSSVVERLTPMDLGVNFALPELSSMSVEVRAILAPAYEQFARSEWREGFDTACQALEEQARRYLKRHMKSTRIQVMSAKGPVTYPASVVNKMPMGRLADTFSRIHSKTVHDSHIEKALKSINQDRIAVVHHRSRAVTERRLRANVGLHMWVIASAMDDTLE